MNAVFSLMWFCALSFAVSTVAHRMTLLSGITTEVEDWKSTSDRTKFCFTSKSPPMVVFLVFERLAMYGISLQSLLFTL